MFESPSELEFRGSIDVESSNSKSGVSIVLRWSQLSEWLLRWKISLTSEILMTTKVSWVSRILMTLRVPISGSTFLLSSTSFIQYLDFFSTLACLVSPVISIGWRLSLISSLMISTVLSIELSELIVDYVCQLLNVLLFQCHKFYYI